MSVLKKQFQEKDVQRLRNLMTGKYGEKTIQSAGYRKVEVDRKEGDIWEEDGRKWTILFYEVLQKRYHVYHIQIQRG